MSRRGRSAEHGSVVYSAEEGFYEFPLSLGKQLGTYGGNCEIGGSKFDNCVAKIHSHGFSLHAADKTLSNIPLIAFQSDNMLFPEAGPRPADVIYQHVQPSSQSKMIHIKGIHIKDLAIPATSELFDQLTAGTLRISVNVATADIEIDEKEFEKLLKYAKHEL